MKQKILQMLPTGLYLQLRYWDYRTTHRTRFEELQALRRAVTDDGYSYKPFDDNRAIFVHIPKCAGVAINKTMFGNLAGGHTTLDEYLNIFEPRCIANYFKFTVVRNPWDRLVSAYFFLKSGGMNHADRTGSRVELEALRDFGTFVRRWVNRTNIWRWHQVRPQFHYMLERRGKVCLDFVAFLENIDRDFAHIARCIGLACDLARSNHSEHASYMDYYDDETKSIMAEAYAEDIEILGYTFDNSSLETQLASRDSGKVYSLRS